MFFTYHAEFHTCSYGIAIIRVEDLPKPHFVARYGLNHIEILRG